MDIICKYFVTIGGIIAVGCVALAWMVIVILIRGPKEEDQ
jgi:hypothetical protein